MFPLAAMTYSPYLQIAGVCFAVVAIAAIIQYMWEPGDGTISKGLRLLIIIGIAGLAITFVVWLLNALFG